MTSEPLSLPEDLRDGDDLLQELQTIYGMERAAAIVAQLGQPSRYAFWVNPLHADSMAMQALQALPHEPGDGLFAALDLEPVGAAVVPALPGVWSVPRTVHLTATAAAENGDIYIQNPSSLLAVRALDPQPHEEVLDLAAAPGGKTAAMAALMENTGRIAAVEPVKARFFRMQANLARCGVNNVDFYQKDGRGVGRLVPQRFARVLLDAPCSSEARMRWYDPSSYVHWSKRKVRETQRKQKRLLQSAYLALQPGGRLVYCMCSFSVAENEWVVDHLLKNSDASLEPVSLTLPPYAAGLTEWQGRRMSPQLSRAVRILPDSVWDGFFLAVLSKPGAC